MSKLIFVDVEAFGGAPCVGWMSEFGAVEFKTKQYFHGILWTSPSGKFCKDRHDGSIRKSDEDIRDIFYSFADWLSMVCYNDRPIFVSDNNGYDWQWINDGFWKYVGMNPFGHSSRRISDFYAGLVNDFYKATKWKHLRITDHDHNPVNDAMGNVEAFERILNGER